jgi:hypothetical protein
MKTLLMPAGRSIPFQPVDPRRRPYRMMVFRSSPEAVRSFRVIIDVSRSRRAWNSLFIQ